MPYLRLEQEMKMVMALTLTFVLLGFLYFMWGFVGGGTPESAIRLQSPGVPFEAVHIGFLPVPIEPI